MKYDHNVNEHTKINNAQYIVGLADSKTECELLIYIILLCRNSRLLLWIPLVN